MQAYQQGRECTWIIKVYLYEMSLIINLQSTNNYTFIFYMKLIWIYCLYICKRILHSFVSFLAFLFCLRGRGVGGRDSKHSLQIQVHHHRLAYTCTCICIYIYIYRDISGYINVLLIKFICLLTKHYNLISHPIRIVCTDLLANLQHSSEETCNILYFQGGPASIIRVYVTALDLPHDSTKECQHWLEFRDYHIGTPGKK